MSLIRKVGLLALITAITIVGWWGFYRWRWISAGREESKVAPGPTTDSGQELIGPTVEGVSPASGAVLSEPPAEISITFPFTPEKTEFKLSVNGKTLKGNPPGWDQGRKTLKVKFPADEANKGKFKVEYSGCPTADGENCVSGRFEFTVE